MSLKFKTGLAGMAFAAALSGFANGVWKVRDLGARGDGVAKDTAAVQGAVDAAAAAGGGTVVLSKGTYISGTVFMKSGVTLHLDEGAELKGSPDREDYCAPDAFPQNYACRLDNTSGGHLLVAACCTNVAVEGPGRIHGNSEAFLLDPATVKQWPNWKKGVPWRPGQMMYFVDSTGVKIENLEVANSPYWSCFLLNCTDVVVSNCHVRTERTKFKTWNGDGIDVDRCRNVRISDCRVETFDDSITLRASHADRLSAPQDCSDVVVERCRLVSSCNAVRVGVGEGVVRDCRLSGLEVVFAPCAFDFVSAYTSTTRGCDIRNIAFSDCEIRKCGRAIRAGYRRAAKDAVIEGLSFRNVRGRAGNPNEIGPADGRKPIEIKLENWAVKVDPPKEDKRK